MSVFDHNNPDNAPNGQARLHCQRLSTLDIWLNNGKQMEIGWQVAANISGVCPTDTSHPQDPTLVIIRTSPGVPDPNQFCEYNGTPLGLDTSVTHSFKETNPNHDGNWKFYLDGSLIGNSPHTDWNDGWTLTNGERHGDDDSAYAKFVGLKYSDSSGEHPWNNSSLFCDDDLDYNANLINAQNDQVLSHNTSDNYEACFPP